VVPGTPGARRPRPLAQNAPCADPSDRRRVLIEKTEKLDEVSKRFYGPLAERSLAWIDKFTNAELEAIVRFLKLGTDMIERRVAELIEERERE